MSKETRACRPCPVDGCKQRYLSAMAAGRHLLREHENHTKWTDDQIMAVDRVGEECNEFLIADKSNPERWIQSDFTVSIDWEVHEDEPNA